MREQVFTQFHQTSARSNYPMRCVQNARFGYIFNPWSDGERAFRNESQSGRSWQAMEAAAANDPKLAARNHLFTYRVLEEFYDFANDPNALNNLIDDPNYADEIQGLRNALEEWMVETDDPALEAFRGRVSRQALDDLMDHLADTIGKRCGRIGDERNSTRGGHSLGASSVVAVALCGLHALPHRRSLGPAAGRFLHLFPIRTASGPQGHFLEYNTGAEPTTGATSLLYTLLLVPGFWLGLDGMGIAQYALVLGAMWLGLSAWLLLLLGRTLSGPFSGWVAAGMFLLCGPLLWGYYSGMAIGLFACAILLTLYLYLIEDRRAPLAATLLVLARPEGIALVLLLLALVAYRRALNWRWGMPLGAYVFQALLLAWWTGEAGASGVEAKWRFAEPHGSLPEQIRAVFFDFAEFVKGILAGSLGHQTSVNLYAYDGNYRRIVFAPFIALFVLAELSYRLWGELSERRLGVAALGGNVVFRRRFTYLHPRRIRRPLQSLPAALLCRSTFSLPPWVWGAWTRLGGNGVASWRGGWLAFSVCGD